MLGTDLLKRRFLELSQQLDAVVATKRYENFGYTKGEHVDTEKFLEWIVKARNLLEKACGQNSIHFKAFTDNESSSYSTNYTILKNLRAVFSSPLEAVVA